MKKKWVAICLILVMLLTACGREENPVKRGKQREAKSEDTSEKVTVTPTAEPTVEPTATPTKEPDKQRTLRMWCNVPKNDSQRYAYEKAIQEMSELYPNVRLSWEGIDNQSYMVKLPAAVAADSLPDIYVSWSAVNLRELVEEGCAYNLNDVYSDYRQMLPEHMCKNMKVDGVQYGIPTNYSAIQLFVNMDLLRDVGYTAVPDTWDELLICCDKLRAMGYYPFGCASVTYETWCISEYFETILLKICGEKELDQLYLGEKSWGSDDVVKAAELLQQLVSKGYFDPKDAYRDNEDVFRGFMNGEYAFYINGSWQSPSIAANMSNPAIGDFPVLDSTRASTGGGIGGPSTSLVVSPSTEDPEFVAKYAFELARLIAKYDYLSGVGLPAWTINYDDSDVNALSAQAAHDALQRGGLVLYGDNMMPPEEVEAYFFCLYHLCTLDYDANWFASALKTEIR